MTVRISVDWENAGEPWWCAVRASQSIPAAIRLLLESDTADSVVVDGEAARAVRAWAEALPGWNDGPEYARHPLLFAEQGG